MQSLNLLINHEQDVKLPVLKAPVNLTRFKNDYIRESFNRALKEVVNPHAVSVLQQAFSEGSDSPVHSLL